MQPELLSEVLRRVNGNDICLAPDRTRQWTVRHPAQMDNPRHRVAEDNLVLLYSNFGQLISLQGHPHQTF